MLAVPLSVAEKAHEVETITKSLKPITNPNMKSDLTTAAALANAALTGALANVEINLVDLKAAGVPIDSLETEVRALKAGWDAARA